MPQTNVKQVVPRASAAVSGQANAETIAINADHRNMVRYASKNDVGYITISEHLQIMAGGAPKEIRRRWDLERRTDEGWYP